MTDPAISAGTVSRRRLMVGGLGVAGGVTLWAGGLGGFAQPASAADTKWKKGTSANGWPVVKATGQHRVEGAGALTASVLDGDVATVFLHVIRRYHYEIAMLEKGEVTGHTTQRTVAQAYESNHLSGTAIAIRPEMYPLRAKDGFFASELTVIRDILADCEGVVRWGGDEAVPKESHFEIAVGPRDPLLGKVAKKMAAWSLSPAEGAGATDATAAPRLRAADTLKQRQKTARSA
ncbi:hypothetical protein [Streptomyces sp. DSM 40907]|uniref:hypothetical protein n=1 Tax=Streptomyces kutzneri TaxID=3051179 RepID=UPI0028D54525|nr:hypothetical protein [Streptomyces sp. DSM 40907]